MALIALAFLVAASFSAVAPLKAQGLNETVKKLQRDLKYEALLRSACY